MGMYKRILTNRLLLLIILLLPLIAFSSPTSFTKNQTHVLILQSYHQGMLWVDSTTKGIQAELPFSPDIIMHHEYLDSKRFPSDSHLAKLKELYAHKFSQLKISVIITVDDNAFNFAQSNRAELFNDAPIVFCGVNFYSPERLRNIADCTGIIERNDYLRTINLALRLHQQANHLFIINDLSTTGKANRKALEEILPKISPKVKVTFCKNQTIEQLKKKVRTLHKNTIVLLLSFNQDASGRYLPYREIAKELKDEVKVPVYCVWDFFFNGCATGGCITRGFDQGATAARLAKKILNGEKVGNLPIITNLTTKNMFDYKKLQEFGVSVSQLPDDSIILNRPYSLYREKPGIFWQIALTIAIFIVLLSSLAFTVLKLLQSQKQIKNQRQGLEITLNSIAESVVATDKRGAISHMNPVAEMISGQKSNEAIGKKLSEVFVFTCAEGKTLTTNLEDLILQQDKPANLSSYNRLVTPDGRELTIAISASQIRDEAGIVIGSVVVFRDLTEEALIQEKLKQSQKMDAIGQLAGGVAHDFNNALSGIIGAVQLLEKDAKTEYTGKIIKLIAKSADRAADLTAKLLAFSRKSRVEIANHDLHTIVQTAIDILSRTIERKIALKSNFKAKDSLVKGNFAELESVILNLGINASHAMPDGGEIFFTTSNIILDEIYCRASSFALTPGNYILLEVKDSGTGIAPENINKIFEPFFTTKEQGKGTGLGLSASYGTIVKHSGAINVYSELNRGTIFRIYLPSIEGPIENRLSNSETLQGTGTILLVDDEPAIRFTNRLILEDAGYKVITAENGCEALEVFKNRQTDIDLIILDMIMPKMYGNECFYKLKQIDPQVKVILCSGFPQDADINEMKRAGMVAFICKPCKSHELLKVVSDAINAG
jgi:PAS domain S-box-containing protein